jgi:hypothetical protein
MLKYSAILIFLIQLLSCKSKKADPDRAYLFYDSINTQMNLNKALQEKLNETATEMLSVMKTDENTKFDTNPIRRLLDSARIINEFKRKNIQRITEIDKKLNYKAEALDYIKTFNDFYETEYEEFLNVIDRDLPDRFEKCKKILLPKLLIIDEKAKNLVDIRQSFKTKYYRKKPEPEYENTPASFTYTRLSELNYKMITIQEGTKIRLLSCSGGACNTINPIYFQFIGIDQKTRDTIRILTLCQSQDFDIKPPSRIGTFKKNFLHQYNADQATESFVIFNQKLSDLEKGDYKTAIGVLEFP